MEESHYPTNEPNFRISFKRLIVFYFFVINLKILIPFEHYNRKGL